MMTLLTTLKNYITIILLSTLIVIGSFYYGSNTGYDKGYHTREVIAINDIRDMKLVYTLQLQKEKDIKQNEINKITTDYNDKMDNLQATTDGVIDTLSRDNRRLLIKVKRSNSSSDNGQCSTTGQFDETAELSEGSAKFLIGQSIKADEWVRSLQATIIQLNGELNKKEE